jgi:hypothetical protein
VGSRTVCTQRKFSSTPGAKRSLKDWQEYIRLLKLNATIFDNLVGDFVDRQSVETEELVAIDA